MSEATEILFQINLVFWLICGIAILIAVGYVVLKVRSLAHHINERVAPITKQVENSVGKVTDAVGRVTSAAENIVCQAEQIAATARSTADHVAHRVESASEVLRDTVVAPAIGINSVITGARKAAEVLRDRWLRRSEAGKDQSSPGES
jgi:cobalamin biosynthesis protein CobD/CbiB